MTNINWGLMPRPSNLSDRALGGLSDPTTIIDCNDPPKLAARFRQVLGRAVTALIVRFGLVFVNPTFPLVNAVALVSNGGRQAATAILTG